jgi:preprotein translocase subunit SecG
MFVLVMVVHLFICVLLAFIILMQSGRGGGLNETFSSAESVFGAQTNPILLKATSIFAALFLVTCLSLALLSRQNTESLVSQGLKAQAKVQKELPQAPVTTVKSEALKAQESVQVTVQDAAETVTKVQAEVEKQVESVPAVPVAP